MIQPHNSTDTTKPFRQDPRANQDKFSIPLIELFIELLLIMAPVPNAHRVGSRYTTVTASMSTSATSTARRRGALNGGGGNGSSRLSREALADLGNAIHNEITRTASLTLGRYTYLNVVPGTTLVTFVKRYFRERRRMNFSSSQAIEICRSLVVLGVISVVDEERSYRTRQFVNQPNCLCRIRRTRR